MRRIRPTPLIVTLLAALFVGLFGQAAAQEAPLIVLGDMVYGHENPPEGLTCTLANRFTHEQMIVWRVKVIDPQTGLDMYEDELESVVLNLADGQSFELEFGEHPPREPVDEYWTTSWVVPVGYPTGILDFTVVATSNDGRTGELITFPIDTSSLTIVASE